MAESARIKFSSRIPRTVHSIGTSVLLIPLGVVSSVLIARTIGPSGKGVFDLIVATAGLLLIVLGFSLPTGVTYVVARIKGDVSSLAQRLALVALFQTLMAGCILTGLIYSGRSHYFLPNQAGRWLMPAVLMYFFLEMLSNYWRAILTGKQEIARINNTELLGRVGQFILLFAVAGLMFIKGNQITVGVLFIIIICISAFINSLLLRALWPSFTASGTAVSIKEAAAFALPCYLGNTTQFLNYRLDVFLVSVLAGYAAVGRYTLAVSLAQLVWLLSNSAASVLLPKVAASRDSTQSADSMDFVSTNPIDVVRHTSRVTRLTLAASFVGASIIGLLATQAIPILYGEAFRHSISALLWLLPGIVAFSTVNILAAYIAGIGKPHLNLVVACLALVVTVVLDFALIPRLEIVGAAMASTGSYLLSALLTIGFFVRQTGAPVRQVLFPTREDLRFTIELAQPLLRRAGLMGVG